MENLNLHCVPVYSDPPPTLGILTKEKDSGIAVYVLKGTISKGLQVKFKSCMKYIFI